MTPQLWGFQSGPYFGLPLRPEGYLILAAYFGLAVIFILAAWRQEHEIGRLRWMALLSLLVAAPLLAQTFLLRLPGEGALAIVGARLERAPPALSIFGGVPWLFAAGFLGPLSASLVGLMTGLARGGWETYSLLTPLHFALQAAWVAWLLRWDYRGWLGRVLRSPLTAGVLAGLGFGALAALEEFTYSGGSWYDALDFSLARLPHHLLASLAEGGLAGLLGELARLSLPGAWYSPKKLSAPPYGRTLASRLVALFIVVGAVAGGALLYGDWLLARSWAAELVEREMRQIAIQASEGVPYFIQTGRSYGRQLAQEFPTPMDDQEALQARLNRGLSMMPFFSRLAVFGADGSALARSPASTQPPQVPLQLEAAIRAGLVGIPQEIMSPEGSMVFIHPLPSGEEGQIQGVLAGWTELASNPSLQPVLAALAASTSSEAFIVDAEGTILVHPDRLRLMGSFSPPRAAPGSVAHQIAADGTRRLVMIQPVRGYTWEVVVITPERVVDGLALRISSRLAAVMLLVGLTVISVVYWISRQLTRPLGNMAYAAERIARGDLDQAVHLGGEDEIGRLAESFERMRLALKGRLEESGLLLHVSQQMASGFNLDDMLPPILEGVRRLAQADLVRLSLLPAAPDQAAMITGYTCGEDRGAWLKLDRQVIDLCRQRGKFVLEHPSRARAVLDMQSLSGPLEALMALPIRHEHEFVGSLWLAHSRPHHYLPEDVNLLSILTVQLGVSISNVRLYHQAERERLQLSAVLKSTPDAVVMVDPDGRIILANPAAELILHGAAVEALGQPAEAWITSPELLDLLQARQAEPKTAEIGLPGGRVMFAARSEIAIGQGEGVGQLCVLRDVTHYKKLDMLKSEFVATVSHDLRAPLTLMRGYLTMLTMVGAMNEQQKEFVFKIQHSVDQMAELIDNLLDLGRIDAGVALQAEPVRVEALIGEVLDSYRPQAANKRIMLDVEIPDDLRPITADPTLLRQALANLVDNAIKFGRQDGRVMIRTSQADGRQRISVEDDGLGIAPADQARLFERFYRARHKDALQERGSGLGLAIVRSIVEQHGGRVAVESRLGTGSIFTIDIPDVAPGTPN
jgi:PAS domain S-box-containing protein